MEAVLERKLSFLFFVQVPVEKKGSRINIITNQILNYGCMKGKLHCLVVIVVRARKRGEQNCTPKENEVYYFV